MSSASIIMGHELFKQLLENKEMTPFQGLDVLIPLQYTVGQFSYFFCHNAIEGIGR